MFLGITSLITIELDNWLCTAFGAIEAEELNWREKAPRRNFEKRGKNLLQILFSSNFTSRYFPKLIKEMGSLYRKASIREWQKGQNEWFS